MSLPVCLLHLLFLMVLLSISIAVGSILILDQSPNRYYLSGQIGGNLGDFFLDWLKIWGTIILLITSYLILIRSYFNFDFYAPIQKIFTQWDERKKRINIEKDRKDKEEAKRKHTQELKEKLDALYETFSMEHAGKSKAAHGRARKALGEIKKLVTEYRKASVAEDKK